jgi:putative membrane protein
MTRITYLALSVAAASALALSSAACENETKPPPEPPQTTAGPAAGGGSTSVQSGTVGDTFGTLKAIHTSEVELGNLAMQKATDPRVKAYAENVVADHKARMRRDDNLMNGLGVTPRETAASQQIKSNADQQMTRLNGMSGADFDRAYIESQINYYRSAIDVFDRDLLPNAKDPQIRQDLTESRARANEHLKEAQDIRLTLINK